jgi:Polyketide cyclase / dehydrase and lipid transport
VSGSAKTYAASVFIRVPQGRVWAMVSDPRNDLKWCSRLVSCDQRQGKGPVVGARYEVVERPNFSRRLTRWVEIVSVDRPGQFVISQDDDLGSFTTTYVLESTKTRTELTQRDEVVWKVPWFKRPFTRFAHSVAVKQQLAELRRVLEEG